jgi:PAS domain S-box-containing protein
MNYTELTKKELLAKIHELEKMIEDKSAQPADNAPAVETPDIFGDIFNQLTGSDFSSFYSDYIIAMLNNMTVPAYFADVDATILGCNKFFESLIGLKSENMIQKQVNEVMPETTAPLIEESGEDTEMLNYETVITDSSGISKEVVISKSIVKNMDGSVAGVIGVINDITEKRTAERALVESEQKLREANATKDRFFSIISHDLRSPFAGIIGFTDTLLSQYHELSEEDRLSFLQDVSDSAHTAFRLVENLLAWARTQLGELAIEPKAVHLYPIVKDLVDLYSPLAKQRRMDVLCDIPKDTFLLADEQTITLVIRNLVNNAVKFNNDGEAIIITAREDADNVIIFIRDHGIGIKSEDIGKLFNLDTNSKVGNSPQKGSGLGLILTKQFIEMNKGTIKVESEFGKFTNFYITLPSASETVKKRTIA